MELDSVPRDGNRNQINNKMYTYISASGKCFFLCIAFKLYIWSVQIFPRTKYKNIDGFKWQRRFIYLLKSCRDRNDLLDGAAQTLNVVTPVQNLTQGNKPYIKNRNKYIHYIICNTYDILPIVLTDLMSRSWRLGIFSHFRKKCFLTLSSAWKMARGIALCRKD